MKTLIAIDGNSLMHRAYHALPAMTTKDSVPTGALFGFVSMLLSLISRMPSHLVVAFDTHAPTFRHKMYDEYKAGRRETPDDLRAQFPIVKELLAKMGIFTYEIEGYEADDLLGTFASLMEAEGGTTLIVTGDRDALQLITDKTHVLLTKKGITETVEYDEKTLFEQYSLTPKGMIDLKGLMGDSSDNIPGIAGVGEKTALKLLEKYNTLENTLESGAINEKGALQKKLAEQGESARMSKVLGTIDSNVPIDASIADCEFDSSALRGALPMLARLELKKHASTIEKSSFSMPAQKAASPEFSSVKAVKKSSLVVHTVNVESLEQLSGIVSEILALGALAIDFEPQCVTLSYESGVQYSIKTVGTLLDAAIAQSEVISALKPVLESNVQKVMFDVKRAKHILAAEGTELLGSCFDLMLADYLLNAARPAASLAEIIESRLAASEGARAGAMLLLRDEFESEMREKGLLKLFDEVEMPLIDVLFDMERTGFCVDEGILTELGKQFAQEKASLEGKIYELAGEDFSILSPSQLSVILFEKLKLPPPKKKTARGYATGAEVLEAIAHMHPIIPLVLEYRFISKLKSTYIDGLLLQRDSKTGRVHTTLNQAVTGTGRISSTEPNLQNIPVRTKQGREIRRAFVASAGNRLVGADYSQIELRVLAHVSGDKSMIQAFESGDDIHTHTASEVFNVPENEVSQELRAASKAVNFGIVYGISEFGLARNLNISRSRAAEYMASYKARYSGITAFMTESVEEAKRCGYAQTLLGRRRGIPELYSSSYFTRSFGERVAMNMPIQGTAADIIKLAMVKVRSELIKRGLKAKLILQIHDELIIDTPADEIEEVSAMLKDCMENVTKLNVPLVADVHVGDSWYDTK